MLGVYTQYDILLKYVKYFKKWHADELLYTMSPLRVHIIKPVHSARKTLPHFTDL
jgi:hypothetical protein